MVRTGNEATDVLHQFWHHLQWGAGLSARKIPRELQRKCFGEILIEPQSNLRATPKGFLYPLVRCDGVQWNLRKRIVDLMGALRPWAPSHIVLLRSRLGETNGQEYIASGYVIPRLGFTPMTHSPLLDAREENFIIHEQHDLDKGKVIQSIKEIVKYISSLPNHHAE